MSTSTTVQNCGGMSPHARLAVEQHLADSLHGSWSALAVAAGDCYVVMLAITQVGNMPMSLRAFGWDEERGDPEQWRALRRRWDGVHSARVVFDSAGFVLITPRRSARLTERSPHEKPTDLRSHPL
jgi:Domain of unknown function (DUF1772)